MEVSEGRNVEVDGRALTRAVKGAERYARRYAVNDRLRNLNASFPVFGGDAESNVNNVGLSFAECHDWPFIFPLQCGVVCFEG